MSRKRLTDADTAPRFVVSDTLRAGDVITVGEDAARHMRVLRLGVGARVVLLDGQGTRADGMLRTVAKRNATVDVTDVEHIDALPDVHALVPVADRDRMLWLAEKSAELGASSWRPVLWRRSRSVAPRGEGSGFQLKVRARMIAALEQSGNAWLPALFPDARLEHAIASVPDGARIVLDPRGAPLHAVLGAAPRAPVTIALGPEGGLDNDEREALAKAGFVPAAVSPAVLRFETAGVAALALVRSMLSPLD